MYVRCGRDCWDWHSQDKLKSKPGKTTSTTGKCKRLHTPDRDEKKQKAAQEMFDCGTEAASNQEPSGRVFLPLPSMQLCWKSPQSNGGS